MEDEPQYKPGDIANGHMLGADMVWRPLQQQAPPPPPYGPPPTVYGPPPSATYVTINQKRGLNHPLHIVLCIVTCGLWLPVYIVLLIIEGTRS